MHHALRQLANSIQQQTVHSRAYSRRWVAQFALILRRPNTRTRWQGYPSIQQMPAWWDEAVRRGLDPRVYAVLIREGIAR